MENFPPIQPKTNVVAIISLVFAVLGLTQILPLIGPIVGIILAGVASNEIYNSDGMQTGESLVSIARVLSFIGLILFIFSIAFLILFFGGTFSYIVKR